MLDGEVTPDAFLVARAPRAAAREERAERQPHPVVPARGLLAFTAGRARATLRAARSSRCCASAWTRAPTPSLKSTWFSALRDTAQTPATVEWLTRVWNEEEKVPGLTLSETDFIRLAQDLAVRDVPGAPAILDRQFERTKNPDRKAQFAFVRPALSADPAEREQWFASLADVANRRHEPWVLEGLRYLHHPLRAAASEKYIEPSLLLLREIQRTGDIFFPKRWMDATLSGHQSAHGRRHRPRFRRPTCRRITRSACGG